MPSDERDKAGVVAPPPLIYLGALVVGLLLNRRFPTTFLPSLMHAEVTAFMSQSAPILLSLRLLLFDDPRQLLLQRTNSLFWRHLTLQGCAKLLGHPQGHI